MKIAIVAPSPVPFLIGGAEKFWWGLHHHINQLTPHVAELFKIPSRDCTFWGTIEAYEEFAGFDLAHFDMVISSKFPAWMVAHRNHHCYLQHPSRGVYDLYRGPTGADAFPDHPALDRLRRLLFEGAPDRELLPLIFSELRRLQRNPAVDQGMFDLLQPGPVPRALLHRLDRIGLSPTAIQRYSAISRTVAERAEYLPPGVPVTINHHPTDLYGLHSSCYRTIFTASRLSSLKRIDLLIKAFRMVAADIEFRIAGTGDQEETLRELARGDDRITLLGFRTDSEIVAEYAQALFVPFVPYDEDYGLITVEAMQSAKAVLTSHDSGGVQELVQHGLNGLSVEPTPQALAEAMTTLLADRQATIAMGRAAQDTAAAINWPTTVRLLLGDDAPPSASGARRKVVVVSTFGVWPPRGGGQYRTFHLARELARDARVTLVCLEKPDVPAARTTIVPGLEEIRVPRTQSQHERAVAMQRELGVSVDDIANIDDWLENPVFTAELKQALADADLVLAAHPYLFQAVRDCGYDGPLWLDAQDVASDLKKGMLPATPAGCAALQRVQEVERNCVLYAGLVLTCSETDAQRFCELYGIEAERCLVIPNGVDMSTVKPVAPSRRAALKHQLGFGDRPVVLCMASWHGPNVDALPLLVRCAEAVPRAVVVLTGSLCSHPLARQLPENIRSLGVLEEDAKGQILAVADLALNLVTSGSGTNLKMLEYAAWQIPIITTPFGNRGLDFVADEHILIVEAGEIPGTVAQLLSVHRNLDHLAQRARAMARLRYDWPLLVRPLRDILTNRRHRALRSSRHATEAGSLENV